MTDEARVWTLRPGWSPPGAKLYAWCGVSSQTSTATVGWGFLGTGVVVVVSFWEGNMQESDPPASPSLEPPSPKEAYSLPNRVFSHLERTKSPNSDQASGVCALWPFLWIGPRDQEGVLMEAGGNRL